jgi:hypothetical protein
MFRITEAPLPTAKELTALPRWALIALVASCARAASKVFAGWTDAPSEHVAALTHAIDLLKQTSEQAKLAPELDPAGVKVAQQAAATAKKAAAADLDFDRVVILEAARCAAGIVYTAVRAAQARTAADAARFAVSVVERAGRDFAAGLAFRNTFDRLRAIAAAEHWTDETPVPAHFFDPL